jgi:hypothetical protein
LLTVTLFTSRFTIRALCVVGSAACFGNSSGHC